MQADCFSRDVFLRAPAEWDQLNPHRNWKLRAPAYVLTDAPAYGLTTRKYLLNSGDPLARVGLQFRVSPFRPRLFPVFRRDGEPVGGIATRTDDILGRGEQDALYETRVFSERGFGERKVQESPSVHASMELLQEIDFAVQVTQEESASNVKPLFASRGLWAARQRLLPPENIKLRQCE